MSKVPIIFTDQIKKVVELSVDQGFGLEDNQHLNAKKKFAIRVSDKIAYSISFWFKQPTIEPCLELSVRGFNCNFEQEKTLKEVNTGLVSKYLINPNQKIISIENKYHYARYIIYNHDFLVNPEQPKTSLSVGTNLIMSEGTSNVFINLACRNTLDSQPRTLRIYNFKVRPLSTPFSTGFIQTNNLLEVWRKNNRKELENSIIDNIADNYLMPYNSIQAVIKL